jgi:hypothetical protein
MSEDARNRWDYRAKITRLGAKYAYVGGIIAVLLDNPSARDGRQRQNAVDQLPT